MCKYSNAIEPLKRKKKSISTFLIAPILLFIDYL
jgi:hypothetical protein